MSRHAILIVFVTFVISTAVASPYWIDWEGDDWPDALGYVRTWGDSQGPHHGIGAHRTLQDGVLTYDSLYDPSVYDAYDFWRSGQMDPGPGELFVIEWRLRVDVVNGPGDPAIAFYSDDGWRLGFLYTEDHIRSVFENFLNISFTPYQWHDYRVTSSDLRSYSLFIDGGFVRQGALAPVATRSMAGFGDSSQSASSLHEWDYVRFGVVPEPRALLLLLSLIAWRGTRRG